MSTLFSPGLNPPDLRAVMSFVYPDIGTPTNLLEVAERCAVDAEAEQRQLELRIAQARAEAAAEAEMRVRREYDVRVKQSQDQVLDAISAFGQERKDYFERAEGEVVRLALAIATKILHREAQLDPMMLAALVRVAVEKMDAGTRVTARVPSADAEKWKACFSAAQNDVSVDVVEDASLDAGACILETELGATDFGIEAQLKEVERGFFDLLAQRPGAQ